MLSLSIFYKRKKFLSKEVFQFKIKDKKIADKLYT